MTSSTSPKACILVVEDNPLDQMMIRRAVESGDERPDIKTIDDGEGAIAYLMNTLDRDEFDRHDFPPPAFIILDLNLPNLDGRDVLRQIRKHEKLATIPVVIMSTSTREEDVEQAYKLGGNCYVAKPTDPDEFLHTVRAITDYWLRIARLPAA